MSDKEIAFRKELKALLEKYDAKINASFGYYEEKEVYAEFKGENCKIDLEYFK